MKMKKERAEAKFILLLLLLLILMLYTLIVYYFGRMYGINNTKVTYYKNGICVFELDGVERLTPIEGWVSR